MKGLTRAQVLYRHVFRNAMLIIIAGFPGAFISAFFSGSLLIEIIFNLDGLGLLGWESVIKRDYPVVFASLFIFSLIGLAVNLISDLTYTWSIRASISRRARCDGAGRPFRPNDAATPRRRHQARRWAATSTAKPALRRINRRRWQTFKAQQARLLVVLDLPRAVRGDAVRRVHRQRQAVPGALRRPYLFPGAVCLSRNCIRRRFRDRGGLPRSAITS